MKPDINSREDIITLVNEFYVNVRKNNLLGPIFDNVMKVNWDKHLPKMYDFWESIMFHTAKYKGFPFAAHLPVNEKIILGQLHFDTWLNLFQETIDRFFSGPNATSLKERSATIKEIWMHKMEFINANKTN